MAKIHIKVLLAAVLIAVVACLTGCPSMIGRVGPRQHGPKIVLRVDPKPGDAWPSDDLGKEQALVKMKDIILKRTASLSLTGPADVTIESPDKLVVELPGLQTPRIAALTLASTGTLEFYYMKDVACPQNPLGKWRLQASPGDDKSYVFTGPKGETLDSAKPSDQPKILTQVIGVPKTKPILTGADLLGNAKAAFRSGGNTPIIEIEFSQKGTQVFSDFTGRHVNEILAVFYGGKLLTAPVIKDRIDSGKAEISGFASLREATEIAGSLNGGSLPVHLKVVEVRK